MGLGSGWRFIARVVVVNVILVCVVVAILFLIMNYPLYETLVPERYDVKWHTYARNGSVCYGVEVSGVYRDDLAHVNLIINFVNEGGLWVGYLTLNIWHQEGTSIEGIELAINGCLGDIPKIHWELSNQLRCLIEILRERPEVIKIVFKDLGVYGEGSFTQRFKILFRNWPLTINIDTYLARGSKKIHLIFTQTLNPYQNIELEKWRNITEH